MKFMLESTDHAVHKIAEVYPFVSDFEFKIEEISSPRKLGIPDENGKLVFHPVNSITRYAYIEIETLEQLMDFTNKIGDGTGLIVFPHGLRRDDLKNEWVPTEEPLIEIYDGYRE